MTTLIVETTAQEECPYRLSGSGTELVYFLSFAAAERYGAQHDLSQAAGILKRQMRISLTPLLTFTEARIETDDDRKDLERIWQAPGALAESCRRIVDAIADAPRLQALLSDFPDLVVQIEELAQIAEWAAVKGAKVRIAFTL